MAGEVFETDRVINLPKLKTRNSVILTRGAKTFFHDPSRRGC